MTSPDRAGATRRRLTAADEFSSWFGHHRESACTSLSGILQKPGSFLMTTFVIAVALVLPALLYLVLQETKRFAGDWDATPRITVYLKDSLTDERAESLGKRLQLLAGVDAVEYISRHEALESFREHTGLGDVLDHLDENPLPPVYVLTGSDPSPAHIEAMVMAVKKVPGVESVQTDLVWAGRLQYILLLIERLALLLFVLFSAGVVLTVANTLRLEIAQRRQEIIVMKLVGATDAFVRRPLLYRGIWYGVAGAILAFVILVSVAAYLSSPVEALVRSYGSAATLAGPGIMELAGLLLAGLGLGLLGAWFTVERHLQAMDPL